MLPASVSQLTFVDFLEALTRLAIAIPMPSDEDMRDFQVFQAQLVHLVVTTRYQ